MHVWRLGNNLHSFYHWRSWGSNSGPQACWIGSFIHHLSGPRGSFKRHERKWLHQKICINRLWTQWLILIVVWVWVWRDRRWADILMKCFSCDATLVLGCNTIVECMLSMCKILALIPSTPQVQWPLWGQGLTEALVVISTRQFPFTTPLLTFVWDRFLVSSGWPGPG